MAVKLIFLGKLADLAGESERGMAFPLDWSGLLNELEPQLGAMARSDKVRIAVNGELIPDKEQLFAGDGDEVALLPPVSGG
jgi:molybdopterin synthase sulfur carrier subunit